MTHHRAEERLRRWLAAEEAEPGDAAEAALAALFAALPRPAPRRGFAGRVLARMRVAPAPRPARRWLRWVAVTALVAPGVAAIVAAVVLPVLFAEVGLAEVMGALAEAVSAAGRWLAAGLAAWQTAAGWTAELLATPEAAAGAAVAALVAAVALCLLHQMIARERSAWYAST
jgi:hypothetical protein